MTHDLRCTILVITVLFNLTSRCYLREYRHEARKVSYVELSCQPRCSVDSRLESSRATEAIIPKYVEAGRSDAQNTSVCTGLVVVHARGTMLMDVPSAEGEQRSDQSHARTALERPRIPYARSWPCKPRAPPKMQGAWAGLIPDVVSTTTRRSLTRTLPVQSREDVWRRSGIAPQFRETQEATCALRESLKAVPRKANWPHNLQDCT